MSNPSENPHAATLTNHVRQHREASGMTQSALATAIGISRQSLSSIEAGRATPGVDIALRIAAILNLSIEQLFQTTTDDDSISAEAVGPLPHHASMNQAASTPHRVALAHIQNRWLAYSLAHSSTLHAADGIATLSGQKNDKQLKIQPLRALPESRENLVITGCAGALGLLANQLNARTGAGRFLWFHASSTAALQTLANHQTHIAGVHLVDPTSGEFNTAAVRRHTRNAPVALITLACWQTGIVAPVGNPKTLHAAECLARPDLRIVTREAGAGTQQQLEQIWKSAGKNVASQETTPIQARGHLEVAHAVALGAADAGIASQDAALAYGLHFIPLAHERFDLVMPTTSLQDPRIQRLLNNLTSSAFRLELDALGYDTAPSGNRVDYAPAA